MFRYSQSSGIFSRDGGLPVVQCYSGNGDGLDNPEAESEKGVGPIPRGLYTIEAPRADEKVGPIAMPLTPDPANEMFGRGDFLIHGDNAAMNFTASEGCIIMDRAARVELGALVLAGDDQLEVVE